MHSYELSFFSHQVVTLAPCNICSDTSPSATLEVYCNLDDDIEESMLLNGDD